MKILIATPLYPPEIAPIARYVKELATRLTTTHSITILTYGYIPEKIEGVKIITIDKHAPRLVRIARFFFALFKIKADRIYSLNGASVELPVSLYSFLRSTPIVFCIGDTQASLHAQKSFWHSSLEKLMRHRSQTQSTVPNDKPEILPFEAYPTQSLAKWENEWIAHIKEVMKLFSYDT